MKTATNTKPTKRQQMVLNAIEKHWKKHGFAPSFRDLMTAMKINSPNGIMCHLKALRKKGLVTYEPNKARTIRLTPSVGK